MNCSSAEETKPTNVEMDLEDGTCTILSICEREKNKPHNFREYLIALLEEILELVGRNKNEGIHGHPHPLHQHPSMDWLWLQIKASHNFCNHFTLFSQDKRMDFNMTSTYLSIDILSVDP